MKVHCWICVGISLYANNKIYHQSAIPNAELKQPLIIVPTINMK